MPHKVFFPFFFFFIHQCPSLCDSWFLSIYLCFSVAIGNRGRSSGGLSGCAVEGAGEAAGEAGRRRLRQQSVSQSAAGAGRDGNRCHAASTPCLAPQRWPPRLITSCGSVSLSPARSLSRYYFLLSLAAPVLSVQVSGCAGWCWGPPF